MRGRLHAGVVWMMMAAAWPAMPVATIVLLATADDAQAQARRSSGGYSRPGGSYARTPSFGGGSRVAPRTPSFGGSGGYSRPGGSYSRAPSFSTPSFGDRSFSRSQGGTALNQFRSQQEGMRRPQQQAQQPRPLAPPAQSQGNFGGFGSSFGAGAAGGLFGGGGRRDVRPNWYSNQGWAPPAYALQGQRSFGLLDGLFLYFMLDNLGRAGSTSWFSNNRDNPDYQRWRAQAEQQAQENTDLRQKLSELDRRLAEQEGQPKDPNYLPPDTPPAVVTAPEADRRTPSVAANDNEGGSGVVWLVLLAGGGGLAYLAWRRSRASTRTGGGAVSGPASGITTAANMVARKLSGEAYTPERFRVGMTLQSDPTPFILAAGSVKVPTPEGGGGLVSVTAVGRMTEGAPGMVRLYLPDGRSFMQLHLDATGAPDECRHFALIDEVAPADAGEWGAWLDPREGMIGWPEFQTKDGKVYGRVWAPGETRIQPRRMMETIEDASGTRTRTSVAMLYAAPTGLAAPAPPTEYILVSAIDEGGQAWVEVHAGIDVNPATLQLA